MKWTLKTDPSGFQIRWSEEEAAANRAAGYWQDSTLVDVARKAAADNLAQVLLIEGDMQLTRGDAWNQALRLASYFLAKGLKPGDVVSLQLPNWMEAQVIALAARMCGVVINPIPPIYRDSEMAYILADCGARMIFIPETFRKHDYLAMIEKLRPDLPKLEEIVVLRGNIARAGGPLTWDQALALPPAGDSDLPKVDPSAVMMVMYTSGTTGKPKGVLHTHYGFDYRVRGMGEAFGIGPDDVVFMPSPITHITGAFWAFDMPWVRGNRSVLIDVWGADDGIRCIEANRCTVSGGATPFLQQLLDAGRARPGALDSLRLFFCGGTTVPPELVREATDTFPNGLFFRVYGSTEMTTTTVGIKSRAEADMGAETDGKVVPPTRVKLVDPESGLVVADGEEGEICVSGPERFFGYLHPADNEGCFGEDGFYHMGDLGRKVHGDYLVITGRKKDIIIRSGENISPKEVEDLLYLHPDVTEAAIVAMPSAATGEKGCAFIIPREGTSIDLAEIKRFLDSQGLARQKFPEHVVLVDALPRVPSGKVKKDELRLRAREIVAAEG
jgi:acyl-CoA synthetase (AMP-forming)/AMP-acid ligase II